MNSSFSEHRALAFIFLLGLGLPSFAQIADQSSKADAPVPSVTYRSVFRATTLGIEQEKVDWRKANEDVGKFKRGHMDILKQEEMDGKTTPPKAAPAAIHQH